MNINWGKLLKDNGLETPGYKEAVEATLAVTAAKREAARLELLEKRTRKGQGKGSKR